MTPRDFACRFFADGEAEIPNVGETENKVPNENNNNGNNNNRGKKYNRNRRRFYKNNRPKRDDKPQDEKVTSEVELDETELEAPAETETTEEETVNEEAFFEEEPSPAPCESEPNCPNEPKKPFYEVVGVRFRDGGKMYYFEPNNIDCGENSHVIVETARGLEYATVVMPKRTVSGNEVVLPLRKLVRIATDNDERRHEENLQKEVEAYNMCLSKIEEHRLDMKLVEVEYAFDNSKLLFYFTSEGRVDFRDLVKDLASVFRTRIELRQIGIRDEAKLLGGLGICGRPFCCNSFLPDFVQVSIKMAKEQNLSLNSAKISGACGRLMCCLRYEYDTYLAESAITPKVDAIVETPDGEGVVVESLPLKGIVKVALDKDPTTFRLYRRDDLNIVGHAKGKHKTVGKNARDDAQKQKNGDGNVKKPEKTDKK